MTHLQAGEPIAMIADRPAPRKTRRRIDWRRGARLLAEGRAPEEAAVALGVDGERFWRHLETSPAFQRQIVAAIQQRNALATILDDMRGRSARSRAAEELLARMERGGHRV